MTIGTLWPLILLILVPLVIALYILKRKYKEKEVSSLLLWQEVYKNTHASTPWEKLRKNIMLPLQLIIILLIILALMKLHLNIGGSTYKNVIVVMDTTGSMAMNYKGKSRLENGKELIKDYVIDSFDFIYNAIKENIKTISEDIESINSRINGAVDMEEIDAYIVSEGLVKNPDIRSSGIPQK